MIDYKEEANNEASERVLRTNQHMPVGKIGTRIHRKSVKKETSSARIRVVRGLFYS